VHHGQAPDVYPLFRVLSDVQDLGPSSESLSAAGRYLREVDSEDLSAVGSLVECLGSGLLLAPISEPTMERVSSDHSAILLRHLVAGVTNRNYALALKVPGVLKRVSDMPAPFAVLRTAWRALALTREQVDAIYGPPRTSLGYLWRRIARPFDLAWRLARSLAATCRS
jgi:hypothetical protein